LSLTNWFHGTVILKKLIRKLPAFYGTQGSLDPSLSHMNSLSTIPPCFFMIILSIRRYQKYAKWSLPFGFSVSEMIIWILCLNGESERESSSGLSCYINLKEVRNTFICGFKSFVVFCAVPPAWPSETWVSYHITVRYHSLENCYLKLQCHGSLRSHIFIYENRKRYRTSVVFITIYMIWL